MQDAKNRQKFAILAQLCRAMSSQLRHVSTIGKKLIKQQYLFHMSPQYGELRHTNGSDRFTSFGHPTKYKRASCLGFVTAAEANQTLHNLWPSPWWYTIYTLLGSTAPDGILPGAKLTLRPNLALSYIGNVTAWHSSSARQPNFAAWYKEQNY